MTDVVIGIFYELPDGRIARTYGWSGTSRMVAYYFDTDEPRGSISSDDMADWKQRRDLTDFPNARDPRLPYVFDLFWDLKHISELNQVLRAGEHDDIDEIRAMVTEHNLPINDTLLSSSRMTR